MIADITLYNTLMSVRGFLKWSENPATDTDAATTATTVAGLLTADGGVLANVKPDGREECPECEELSELPCLPCFRDAKQA